MKIDQKDFRNTLGRFATGVTVVTTQHEGQIHGITVNAFMSVSLDPPLVLVSIDKKAKAHETLAETSHYGVSLLQAEQEVLSNHFAGWSVDGLEIPYSFVNNFPLIDGAVGNLICRIVNRVDAGDHTLQIGEVEYLNWQDDAPLLYYAGKYGRLAEVHEKR